MSTTSPASPPPLTPNGDTAADLRHQDVTVTYQLHRLEEFGEPPTAPPLGTFADFEAALAARDRDVIAQLTADPWPPREISHLIIGPGLSGPRTEHPVVTYAGVEVTEPDPAGEVAAVEAWLDAVHGR